MDVTSWCEENPMRRFQVRDITGDRPCFDLVFHDDENRCQRCSESVWDTHAAALQVAEHLEQSGARPCHWDVLRKQA